MQKSYGVDYNDQTFVAFKLQSPPLGAGYDCFHLGKVDRTTVAPVLKSRKYGVGDMVDNR